MDTQKPSRLKRWVIITFAVVGYFGVMTYQFVTAATPNQTGDVPKKKTPATVIVAQSADQTPESQGDSSPSESDPPESKAEEKNESPAPPKKPFKKFSPSEQIEAEQAVDFPYDI